MDNNNNNSALDRIVEILADAASGPASPDDSDFEARVRALRSEAGAAGDTDTVEDCTAILGDDWDDEEIVDIQGSDF